MSIKAYSSYTIVDVVDGMQWQDDAASHPSSPKEGWAYYNTVDKCSYLYDGAKWVVFAKDGSGVKKINTHVRNQTLAWWNDHVNPECTDKNWTTGSAYDNTHIKIGDTAYVSGTVSDVTGVGGARVTVALYGTVESVTIDKVVMSPSHLITSGQNGSDGDGITDEVHQYCQHDSCSSAPTDGWSDVFPSTWDNSKQYVWTRIEQTWTNNSNGGYIKKYTTPTLMSTMDVATKMAQAGGKTLVEWCKDNDVSIIHGSTIATGSITADQIQAGSLVIGSFDVNTQTKINTSVNSTKIEYCLSSSATEFIKLDGYDWSTTAPDWNAGAYMWQRITITHTDHTTENPHQTVTTTCIQGAKGADAITSHIYSSAGTSFEEKQTGNTVLIARLYQGGSEIDAAGQYHYYWYIVGSDKPFRYGKTITVDISTISGKGVYFEVDDEDAKDTATLGLARLGVMVLKKG